eukprot:GEMP01071926.1.p1 GENE.GEMP01071926.1~~GEMP01071926.1.p1  ORF type:complete len:337 (+),score=81.65 GEMP01071926.1:27-1037(+)
MHDENQMLITGYERENRLLRGKLQEAERSLLYFEQASRKIEVLETWQMAQENRDARESELHRVVSDSNLMQHQMQIRLEESMQDEAQLQAENQLLLSETKVLQENEAEMTAYAMKTAEVLRQIHSQVLPSFPADTRREGMEGLLAQAQELQLVVEAKLETLSLLNVEYKKQHVANTEILVNQMRSGPPMTSAGEVMRATGQSMGSLESGSGTTELLASATLKDNPLRVENVRLNECYRMLTSSVRELQRREAVLQAELDELRLIHKHGPKLTEDDRRQIRLLATAQRRLSEAETERDELKAEAAALRCGGKRFGGAVYATKNEFHIYSLQRKCELR